MAKQIPKIVAPSIARYSRIQTILKNQPAFKDRLGPLEKIDRPTGGTVEYPMGVAAVIKALQEAGIDAGNAPMPLVVKTAGNVLDKIKYDEASIQKRKREEHKKAEPEKAEPKPPKPPKAQKARTEPKPAEPPAAPKPAEQPAAPKAEPKAEQSPPPPPATKVRKARAKKEKPKPDEPQAPKPPSRSRKAVKLQDDEAKKALEAERQRMMGEQRTPCYYPYTAALSLMLTVGSILEMADKEAGSDSRKRKVADLTADFNKLRDQPVVLPAGMKPLIPDAEVGAKA
jgi:hypothetical protein